MNYYATLCITLSDGGSKNYHIDNATNFKVIKDDLKVLLSGGISYFTFTDIDNRIVFLSREVLTRNPIEIIIWENYVYPVATLYGGSLNTERGF